MAASANISWTLPAQGSINQQVQYRVVGTTNWTTLATVGPTVTSYAITGMTPADYEWRILNICPNGVTTPSALREFYVCSCPTGYTKNTSTGACNKALTQNPTTLFSNYCLAPSRNSAYTSDATRIYNVGFVNASIGQASPAASGDVYAEYTDDGQWVSTGATDGPMNRAGVWIDSDCDGVKDALTHGTETTISYAYNNTGAARRVYVGMGADNLFTLKVNGINIASTTETIATSPAVNNDLYYRIFHVFPVNITTGWNYFNAVATGDGSVNDSIAMTIYDVQVPTTFDGVHSSGSTYDTGLNVLFTTSSIIGQHIDISTCPDGYSLDTSGGQGAYVCRRTDVVACS